mmetsp:Transcript_41824/g.61415  ORF Transcript_41824/g.61415 Transcript_41824/m.61415 type:complete len:279 (-) Transcript_41824:425-1261(-)
MGDCSNTTKGQPNIIYELYIFYRNRSWKVKIVSGAFSIISALTFSDLFLSSNPRLPILLENFIAWMNYESVAALFAFIGLFIVSTVIFIPPFFLTFGAGFVYGKTYGLVAGVWFATIVCFIGSFWGAIIAFYRSRYIERNTVKLFAKRYPIIRAADSALKRNGLRVMLLLRLCPLIPFNALNYIGGVTGVDTRSFMLSLFGILPSQFLTVSLRASASGLGDDNLPEGVKTLFIPMGCIFGIIGIVALWHYAKKEIRKVGAVLLKKLTILIFISHISSS